MMKLIILISRRYLKTSGRRRISSILKKTRKRCRSRWTARWGLVQNAGRLPQEHELRPQEVCGSAKRTGAFVRTRPPDPRRHGAFFFPRDQKNPRLLAPSHAGIRDVFPSSRGVSRCAGRSVFHLIIKGACNRDNLSHSPGEDEREGEADPAVKKTPRTFSNSGSKGVRNSGLNVRMIIVRNRNL